MKRLVLWALLALSLSGNVAVAAVALWHRSVSPAPSPDEPRIFSRVSLDAEQRARITELRARLMDKRDGHVRRMGQLRTQLAAAVVRPPEDRAAVDAVLHEIAAVQADYQEAVVAHVLAVRDVLRPDQRPAFEKMLAERIGGPAFGAGPPMDCENCPGGRQ